MISTQSPLQSFNYIYEKMKMEGGVGICPVTKIHSEFSKAILELYLFKSLEVNELTVSCTSLSPVQYPAADKWLNKALFFFVLFLFYFVCISLATCATLLNLSQWFWRSFPPKQVRGIQTSLTIRTCTKVGFLSFCSNSHN